MAAACDRGISRTFLLPFVERCGAVVKRRTRDREVPGSIPTNCKCCFLEQETLSTLLSTGFYPGKTRATWKISTRLLNVLPSINKVDYYYYYYCLVMSSKLARLSLYKAVTSVCIFTSPSSQFLFSIFSSTSSEGLN